MEPIIPYLILVLAILVVIGILAVLWVIRHPGQRMKGSEYRAFFVIGLGYVIIGAALSIAFPEAFEDFLYFMLIGAVFLGIGLVNIRKWK